MKQCGFVTRVSTDIQARNKEGSLKNQLQRLEAHVDYKNITAGKQEWFMAAKYVLEGVSGKDSFRSPQFTQLFEDIKTGRVNTVVCTALDRICRSVKDFLNFFEILTKYNVEFVCLKQNYDTTSSQGKLFITIMMALAEFEREQTSERTRDAIRARSERGLWSGGQLLGYNIDIGKRGYLFPNETEKVIVQFIFDTYLKCGSITKTAKIVNEHGYRTKEYKSRRDQYHPAAEFNFNSVRRVLGNYAYIGKKEINKKKAPKIQSELAERDRYRIVKAAWDPIINEELFEKTQQIMLKNYSSGHNVIKKINHTYILNHGLLECGICGGEMEGRAGTGHLGRRYYYYKCKDKKCRFEIPANEIEKTLIGRIKAIASQQNTIDAMIEKANKTLQKELPIIQSQKTVLEKELANINQQADALMSRLTEMNDDTAFVFLKEKLSKLGDQRKDVEKGIASLTETIRDIEHESIKQTIVQKALEQFSDVFDHIKPYQQKELMQLVLHKAIISRTEIKMALYGKIPDIEPLLDQKLAESSALSAMRLVAGAGFEPAAFRL